MVFLQMPR